MVLKAAKSVSRSSKAGLNFPVGRMHRRLKDRKLSRRTGGTAAVMFAAVLEYLTAEVLELAGNAAQENKCKRIIPRHISMAVRNDAELNKMLGGTAIASCSAPPNVSALLLAKKKSAS